MEAAPGARRASLQFSSKPLYFHFITLKICDALEPRIDRSSRTDFDLTSKKVDPIAFVNSTFPRYSHAPPPPILSSAYFDQRDFSTLVYGKVKGISLFIFFPLLFRWKVQFYRGSLVHFQTLRFSNEEEIERFWRKILPKNLYIMDKRKMRCWKKNWINWINWTGYSLV